MKSLDTLVKKRTSPFTIPADQIPADQLPVKSDKTIETGITQAIFFALGPLWINVVHIAYEDFDGCGEMKSSVSMESCHHREGISSQIYGINKRGRCQQTII